MLKTTYSTDIDDSPACVVFRAPMESDAMKLTGKTDAVLERFLFSFPLTQFLPLHKAQQALHVRVPKPS